MIKIKNIYHMLAYAFHVLNEDSYANVATEEFDNVGDLFTAILAKGIANQLKRGLHREYRSKTDVLRTPVGKINITASIKHRTMLNKQLVCHFDTYTENTYMNQIVKTTAILLIRSAVVSRQRKQDLKRVMLYFSNIDDINPRTIRWSNIKYHRNNATYKMLINICYLTIEGLLLTQQEGSRKLAHYIDDQRMHRLFEKFVLQYYRKHYPQLNASPTHIDWDVDDGVMEFLPTMKSDITLQFKGKTVIIDTKYYSRTMQTNRSYNSRTLHSHNMYQIFSYVKNYDTPHSGDVSGVLLYAKTDEDIVPDNDYMISGNRISVKTIDLNTDFPNIARQLNTIAERLLLS